MIINKKTKTFFSRSDKPNENWLHDENFFVVADGSELQKKIRMYADVGFNLVVENDELVDIEPFEAIISQDEINMDTDYRISLLELGV